MSPSLIVALFVVVVCSHVAAAASIQCKDDGGQNVDWFIAYKLPMDPASTDPQFRSGSAYFYMSPSSPNWKRSPKNINATDSIVGLTLQPLYASTLDKVDFAYVFYNDQAPPPAMAVFRNGHTKGVVVTQAGGGYWLVHSVPHFPKLEPGSQTRYYPPGGLENGQIFLCMSLPTGQIDSVIGNALLYTKPNIYEAYIPGAMNATLPKLLDVVNNNATKTKAPWYTLDQLKTVGGVDFMVFVKGIKFRKDIYSAWIAQKLATGLDVQSWLQGTHPLASDCVGKYPVYNVLGKELANEHFNCTNDHSKWANGIDQPWTCISDLNRAKPQKTRGGVALCVSDKRIWTAFKSAILVTQPCDKPKP